MLILHKVHNHAAVVSILPDFTLNLHNGLCKRRRRYTAVVPGLKKKKRKCMSRRKQWQWHGWSEKIQKATTARSRWRNQPWPLYTPDETGQLCPKLGHRGACSHVKQWKDGKRETDWQTDGRKTCVSIPDRDFGRFAFPEMWDGMVNRRGCNLIFEGGILGV